MKVIILDKHDDKHDCPLHCFNTLTGESTCSADSRITCEGFTGRCPAIKDGGVTVRMRKTKRKVKKDDTTA